MKILIVDDDQGRSTALVEHLVSAGFSAPSIEVATCADAAKALLRQRYFDALVLDVVLPKRANGQHAASTGLQLLDQVDRASFLNKPERIIGITAHVEDIAEFRPHFDRMCYAVIEAREGESSWRDAIAKSLGYTYTSKMTRVGGERHGSVITIHGIRTYGAWQARLQQLVNRRTDRFRFYEYKYGYFSALKLLVPFLRKREVRRLRQRLSSISDVADYGRAFVFCHSFGTYLAVAVVRDLVRMGQQLPQLTLILCGSVLPSTFDFSFLPEHVKVVNDCGEGDYILLLSEAFVPGMGMAGRCGFLGFNNSRVTNRYFAGGHSLYFKSDDFMAKNWLPLLAAEDPIAPVDERSTPGLVGANIEGLARLIGTIKRALLPAA